MTGIKILGTGYCVPEKVIKNDDYKAFVDTNDEWIRTRTGISERHISMGEPTWLLGTNAAKKAISAAKIAVSDIGLIILTSVTADFFSPSTSSIIQNEIGAIGSMVIDVNCACAGFVYALDMAQRYLATDDDLKTVLVVSAENLSKITDYTDRSTCVLFGDAAAACVVERSENGLYSSFLGADGTGGKFLFARSIPQDNVFMSDKTQILPKDFPVSQTNSLVQNGKEVYKFAVKILPLAVEKAAEKAKISLDEIALIIPHQANIRIIETASKNLGISMDKFYVNLENYGNTSSASIPLALAEAVEKGKLLRGDKICLVGFGAGLTYGAVILEY
ncbi:MAG: beta-ketoacyl-ACP synthase III [Oscillospiraceae bacterium]